MSGMTISDKFFGEENGNTSFDKQTPNELRFTGNWFIDAGILGFVNLMEEVYGWDLEKLQKKINENPELVYYWYFPIAFVYFNSKNKLQIFNIEIPDPPKDYNSILDLFEKAWDLIANTSELIEPTKKGEKRISLSSKGRFHYFHNFLFFQPSWNINKQKEAFMEILNLKNASREVLVNIDKTINKFLPSANEFKNEPYSKGFITLESLHKLNTFSQLFILTFPLAFIEGLLPEKIFFYSPALEFTYRVNKKLVKFSEKANDKSKILQITLRAIIDSIIETKSIWVLENMYFIKYQLGKNQNILSAEYIGFSKLRASILIEDSIREALNANLQIDKGRWVWVLEEFIKNKPLYVPISRHVFYCLREKNEKGINRKASLYALAIDAKIKENNSIGLFSDRFFENYRGLVDEIKECYTTLNLNAINISRLFDNYEEKRKICYNLVSTLKKRNKIAFLNTLLKKFLENAGRDEVSHLNRFVFENIVSNDISWKNYALALVVGILSFRDVGGEDESEE